MLVPLSTLYDISYKPERETQLQFFQTEVGEADKLQDVLGRQGYIRLPVLNARTFRLSSFWGHAHIRPHEIQGTKCRHRPYHPFEH